MRAKMRREGKMTPVCEGEVTVIATEQVMKTKEHIPHDPYV